MHIIGGSVSVCGNFIGLGFVESGNQLVGSLDPSIDNDGANTIAHNTTWGLLGFGNGSVSNEFRGNSLHSNGIAAVSHTAGSNFEIPPPLLNAKLDQNKISGSIIFPQFAEDAEVDIFRNNPGENQQREYVGQATVFTAGPNTGNFEFAIPNIQLGDNYTAVMTILGNTSAPSLPVMAPNFTSTQTAEIKSDGALTLTGTALPNALINLYIAGELIATTTADTNGNYTFNLSIEIGDFNYSLEMVVGNQTFTLTGTFVYSGHSRVYNLEDHYRTEGFIRKLDNSKLSAALEDFEGNVNPSDGKDYEVQVHDSANNIINITKEAESHTVLNNNMNEASEIGSFRTNIVYDDLGRLVSYTETKDSLTTHYRLTWDMQDQLTKVENSPDGVIYSDVVAYEYYPGGMRASKYVHATDTRENYYGMNMMVHEIYEFQGIDGEEPSAPTKEFIYEGMDRPIAMFANADGNGSTGAKGGREVYFYHTNPRGDVYALTAGEDTATHQAGDIVERYDYSLFGEIQVTDGNFAPVSDNVSQFGNPYGFGGAYLDTETDMYQMRFRYYDPAMRGFISRDPIEDDSLGNLYAFVENNPGSYLDPLGLDRYLIVGFHGSLIVDRYIGGKRAGVWRIDFGPKSICEIFNGKAVLSITPYTSLEQAMLPGEFVRADLFSDREDDLLLYKTAVKMKRKVKNNLITYNLFTNNCHDVAAELAHVYAPGYSFINDAVVNPKKNNPHQKSRSIEKGNKINKSKIGDALQKAEKMLKDHTDEPLPIDPRPESPLPEKPEPGKQLTPFEDLESQINNDNNTQGSQGGGDDVGPGGSPPGGGSPPSGGDSGSPPSGGGSGGNPPGSGGGGKGKS